MEVSISGLSDFEKKNLENIKTRREKKYGMRSKSLQIRRNMNKT